MTDFIDVGVTNRLHGSPATSNLGRSTVKIVPTSPIMPVRIASVETGSFISMSPRQAQELAKLLWAASRVAKDVKHSYEVAGDAVTRAHANRDRIVQRAIEAALEGK